MQDEHVNTNRNVDDFYKTSDLPLAGVLCVLGFPLYEIEKLNARRSMFVFQNSKELAENVNSFWRCELKVEPQAYFNQLKILKARLYQQ